MLLTVTYDLITGKMSELFMTILTSKLQLYTVNEAYVNDADSIQVSESDKLILNHILNTIRYIFSTPTLDKN